MSVRILRTAEVSAITGLAPSTVQARSNRNSPSFDRDFPTAIRIGKRALGFIESEVYAWLKSARVSNGNFNITETWSRRLPLIGLEYLGNCRYRLLFAYEFPSGDQEVFEDWLFCKSKDDGDRLVTLPDNLDHAIRTYCPLSGNKFYFHELFVEEDIQPCQLPEGAEAERLYWIIRVLNEAQLEGWAAHAIEPKPPTTPQPLHPNRPSEGQEVGV